MTVLKVLSRKDRITLAAGVICSVATGILHFAGLNPVVTFVIALLALAALAALVGQATEQVGTRLGPGATGVLQSGLGNLPELFVSLFALRAGLVEVVQATIIGSILGNSLLVLGLAFLVGGLRHGAQRFASEAPRIVAILTVLAVAALAVPTMAHGLHVPASAHIEGISIASAIVLLIVFAGSVPFSLKAGGLALEVAPEDEAEIAWPLWLAAALLAVAGVGAAFISDWFIAALEPAIEALHLSQAFTGLVIVAIAGNAVENVVGIQLAAANKPDYAISVILNSSLQVALFLSPALVLLSLVVGGAYLTLVMPPMLVVAVGLAALLGALIVFDGESTWLEGMALLGLYAILAASFWWG
ncbi:MAG: calcium/proton exchanger [Thermomicrobiales bacterium]